MRRVTVDDLQAVYREKMHLVHLSCLIWRMRSLSHRLLEFGPEASVSHLLPHEALMLAAVLPPHMHDPLVQDIYRAGDEMCNSLIDRVCPWLVQPEVAHV